MKLIFEEKGFKEKFVKNCRYLGVIDAEFQGFSLHFQRFINESAIKYKTIWYCVIGLIFTII